MILLLWDATIKVSIILAVALLALPGLRGRSAAFRHWILSAAVVCAFLVPAFSWLLPAEFAQPSPALLTFPAAEWVESRVGVPVEQPMTPSPALQALPVPVPAPAPSGNNDSDLTRPAGALAMRATDPPPTPASRVRSIDPQRAIGWLWAAGAAFGVGFILLGALRLAWVAAHSDPLVAPAWTAISREIAARYGIRRPIALRRSRHPWMLATWGVIRPEVLLPAGALQWSEERIRIVLAHELAHIRRRDWPIQIGAGILRSIQWFNPLAWAVHRRLRQESEQACDDAVLLCGIPGADYASHLLALARSVRSDMGSWMPASLMARRSTLQKRVAAMLNPGLNRSAVSPLSMAIVALLCLGIGMPVAAFRAASSGQVQSEIHPVSQGGAPSQSPVHISANVLGATLAELFQAPASAGGSGIISGRVVRLGTAEPLDAAFVELRKIECGESGVPAEVYTALTGRPNPYWAPAAADTTPPPVFTASTSADGRFSFRDLEAGAYCIVAYRPNSNYFPGEYQQRGFRGRGVTITLAAGQQIQDVALALIPGSSISGRILDANGEPVAHARVQALEPFYLHGQLRLNPVINLQTNDLGEYRLFWLRPGRYYVAATLEDPRRRTFRFAMYPPGRGGRYEELTYPITSRRELEDGTVLEDVYAYVYYGGGVDMHRATPVDLAPGTSVNGIDIPLGQGKLRAHHVRGVVLNGATGQPAANVSVRLLPRQWTPHPIVPSAFSDSTGAFDIDGVPVGAYTLFATGRAATGRGGARNTLEPIPVPELIASIPVDVGGLDIDGLKVVIGAGFDLRGRITVEGRTAAESASDFTRLRVRPFRDPDIIGQPQALLEREPSPAAEDGSFVLRGISSGDYRLFVEPVFLNPYLIVPPPPGPESLQDMYVKSLQLGRIDVLNQGLHITGAPEAELEVVLARGHEINGRVLDGRQQPVVNATVVLVPNVPFRERLDRYKIARTDTAGRFRVRGASPGDYRIFAWDRVEDGAWHYSEFLRPYENRGRPLRIDQGAANGIDLQVIPQ